MGLGRRKIGDPCWCMLLSCPINGFSRTFDDRCRRLGDRTSRGADHCHDRDGVNAG